MTTEIPVDDDVPMPPPKGGKANRVYPFRTMKVGQSFAVEPEKRKLVTRRINTWRARSGSLKKFASRGMPDGTVRFWRVE